MSSPIQFIRKEMILIKRPEERGSLAFVAFVFATILLLILSGRGDYTAKADQSMEFSLIVPDSHWVLPLDLDRLEYSVAMAESGNCGTAWHKAKNNCWSIMEWNGGQRHLKAFKSVEEGRQAFKSLWRDHYRVFPTIREAIVYTGSDRSAEWLANVKKIYYYQNK